MGSFLSIIIPNFNGSRTIGNCLESVFDRVDDDIEVIVVDDCSDDGSVDIINQYPCRLIMLEKRSGASAARNSGAFCSKGDILFFLDADCVLAEDTIRVVRKNLSRHAPDVVIGGTYTPIPYDAGFFSLFQSVFINYFETKNSSDPDYLATHAMVVQTETFRRMGGFREKFLPILEDVEFCHRLRSAGYKLRMDPGFQVRHQFNYSFLKSMKNAARKTRYWLIYSLMNRDLFSDSGTASRAIKITGGTWCLTVLLALFSLLSGGAEYLAPLPFLWALNLTINHRLFQAFNRTGGFGFAVQSGIYYLMVYPCAVLFGAVQGIVQYPLTRKEQNRLGEKRLTE